LVEVLSLVNEQDFRAERGGGYVADCAIDKVAEV
jgi:hypothetical protein